MKRKRIKKYQSGGFTPGSGFAGTNTGQGIGMFGGLAGGLIEGADMKDGRMSTGGALGSGALKGASMGMALGPLGALIGAGVGMAGGLMKRDQVNAADDARLKAERDEERLRANMENQMKHQQMNQVLDQFPVKGNNAPRFARGGDTDPAKSGPSVTPEKAMSYKNAQIRQYNPSRMDLMREAFHNHNMKDDSTFENGVEIIDPTGISSWDDAYRAGVNRNKRGGAHNADEMLDIAGAMPIFGKYKAGHNLGKSASKKLAHSFKDSAEKALAAGKHVSNRLNVVDGVEDEVGFMNKYAMGGPTGNPAGEKYFAMPNYGNSMDPNAQPSMDFYYDGKQMPAAEFVSHLPEGTNINDVASYGYAQSKPTYDPKTGWSYAGQNSYMQDFQSMSNAPQFGGGGETDPYADISNDKRAMLRAASVHPKANEFAGANPELMNALGSMPYDQFNTLKDSASSIKSQAKALKGQGIGATLDFVRNLDISSLKPLREGANMSKDELLDAVLGQTDLGWATRKAAKLALNSKEFKMGGATMGPGYEVEGGEMMQTKGETPQTYGQGGVSQVASQEYEVQGPKHSNGGVQANDNQGARVYSDKLRVDNALLSKLSKL